MAPYTISLRPRRVAQSLMSTLSALMLSTASSLSVQPSTRPSTQSSTHLKRCFYCPKVLANDSARSRHIFDSPACKAAQHKVLLKAKERQEAEHQRGNTGKRGAIPQAITPDKTNTGESTAKRRKVTVETVPDEDDPPTTTGLTTTKQRKVTVETVPDEDDTPTAGPSAPPVAERPASPTNDEVSSGEDTQSGSSARARRPVVGCNWTARRWLRRHGGLYIEDFPNPLAGSPILNDRAPAPDLDAYMKSCGTMADPENFEVAELLMTSGLTDTAKDHHLKSSKYKGKTPWPNADAMLADIDKLRHGPEFKLKELEGFAGRRLRSQFIVHRNLIDLLREIFANRRFKKSFRAAPAKAWTSAAMKVRVYGDACYSEWWWKEQERMARKGKRNATIAPLIVATDQTTLSIMCGGQKAYPPSRQAWVLLGYLPVDSFEDVEDDKERRRLKADLVHRLMEKLLVPLKVASEEGVEMWCLDGRLRRVYP
ncbi:hypothetical protein FRC07_007166 [Ceratobasidium sp. 392]|nr:hypothetical protein FRC07_007166 [Ceratobasidium sp. 392]